MAEHEHRYVIAFRNDYTQGEWVMSHKFTGPLARAHALSTFRKLAHEVRISDLALFFYREGDDWHEGTIHYAVWNNWPGKPIGAALAGLANLEEAM